MDFNTLPLTTLASTWAKISGVAAPEKANKNEVADLLALVKNKTGKETCDKLLIYNPDAIGQEFYGEYREKIFAPLDGVTDLKVNYLTAFPPKTPVCFATMFTGATPEVHGIQHYEKPVLTVDTLFDAWARGGKKVALISKAGQSIPKIFAERKIDYFLVENDSAAVDKAIDLMQNADYDVIECYNQEYDDMLHMTYPRSCFCKRAARHYVANYVRLTEAVKQYWSGYDVLTSFSPDHGSHRIGGIFLGTHGSNIPSDMNITHFYSVYTKKKANE